VAGAYYWRRFYSHQPELYYDNPHVRKAILAMLDFWFALGVDGLRLDAIPYLFEREGTNCENLPDTHRFLKEMRAHVDAGFKNRLLGRRTAQMHMRPASDQRLPEFKPEAFSKLYQRALYQSIRTLVGNALPLLRQQYNRLPESLRPPALSLSPEENSLAIKLLELQRHALLMYTSCGWFFDDISGLETVQVIQFAGRSDAAYRQIFDTNAPLLLFLKVLDVPAPRALAAAAEYLLNADIRRAFEHPVFDLNAIRQLMDAATLHGVTLGRNLFRNRDPKTPGADGRGFSETAHRDRGSGAAECHRRFASGISLRDQPAYRSKYLLRHPRVNLSPDERKAFSRRIGSRRMGRYLPIVGNKNRHADGRERNRKDTSCFHAPAACCCPFRVSRGLPVCGSITLRDSWPIGRFRQERAPLLSKPIIDISHYLVYITTIFKYILTGEVPYEI
jgi:hypothetical protein